MLKHERRIAGGPLRLDGAQQGASPILKRWPSRRVAFAALLAAEVVVLSLVALSVRSKPVFGVFVREDAASITLNDQSNVMQDITVSRVVSPVPGWLVAQTDTDKGTPGEIVGAKWVPAGTSLRVPVSLNVSSRIPRRVHVTLLADSGRRQVLEYRAPDTPSESGSDGAPSASATPDAGVARVLDKPVIAGGSVVRAQADVARVSFAVGPTQASVAESTIARGATSLVIPRVVTPAHSWVSVSLETTTGQLGGVLGTKLITPGEHENVVVPLNVQAVEAPMVATLHVDLGTRGRFDFSPLHFGSSLDQPYVAGGRVVSAPVHVSR